LSPSYHLSIFNLHLMIRLMFGIFTEIFMTNNLHLLKIGRIPIKKVLIGVMEDASKLPSLFLLVFRESDNYKKWESISWGRKFIVQKKITSLYDFDRFKVMLAKIKRSEAICQELPQLKPHVIRREVVMKFLRQKVANQAARRES
ncbi:hypothetical protein MKX01_015605, partial [Papaver californicum]